MCDSLVALAPETADGVTWFAKNSDRSELECQPFACFPATRHRGGARVSCTHIEIPQVPRTFRVMGHSPWWVWGFEHGVNECGVAIGNHTIFSKQEVEEAPGLIGMDLVRLGLERANSARSALAVITRLLEAHGQGGPGFAPQGAGYHNSFLIADPRQAWILETSGRHWAARRAQLDSVSNHLCLGADWELASENLERFAREQGWGSDDGRLDVAGAYRNLAVPGRISEGRRKRCKRLLEAERGRIGRATLEGILRDHGEGRGVRLPGATAHEERFFTLCMHSEPVGTTTASLIASLPQARDPIQPSWISFATPCTGIFLPVYLEGVIPAALERGQSAERKGSAWWSFKRLEIAAARDFPRYTPRLREAWTSLEASIEEERVEIECAARLAASTDSRTRILSEFMERITSDALQRAESLRAEIVGSESPLVRGPASP